MTACDLAQQLPGRVRYFPEQDRGLALQGLHDQITYQLGARRHSLLIGHRGQDFFDHARQMQGQAVCSLGRVQFVELMRPGTIQGFQARQQSSREQGFVAAWDGFHVNHADEC